MEQKAMDWKAAKGTDASAPAEGESTPAPEAPQRRSRVNANLSPEEMKGILNETENKNPGHDIQPVIIQTKVGGGNRVYMVRGLLMKDMNRVEEVFKTLYKEDLDAWKKKFEVAYLGGVGKKSLDNLDVQEKEAYQAAQQEVFLQDSQKMMTKANDRAVNMVAVAWPETHASDVANEEVFAGDLETVAVTAQVMSGWSRMETDIDTYERNVIEERRIIAGQTEEEIQAEADMYEQLQQ